MSRRINLSAPLIVSLVALAVMVLLLINQGPPLLMAALGPSGDGADPQATLASLVDDHRDDFEVYQDRFNGRSFFFKPPRWPPAPRQAPPPRPADPVVVVEQTDPEPVEPVQPSAPPNYTGPKILFVVGDSVWFESDRSTVTSFEVSVGREKEGIRVIETNLPWSVKLGHEGGEYDVPIFERVDLFEGGTPTASTGSRPRFPGLVDASNTTSREERAAAEDEAAGAEDSDEGPEGAEELTSADDGSSAEPAATVAERDVSITPDAAVADGAGAEDTRPVAPEAAEGSTSAETAPVATVMHADPDSTSTDGATEPLMGPPTRGESTSSLPAGTETNVAAAGAPDVSTPAKATAPPAGAATENPTTGGPTTEKPAAPGGDTTTATPAAAPRPGPQRRPGGRPAPEQRQGGRPAPEQQEPAKSTGGPEAGASGKPGKKDESDSSDTGAKSSEEPSNADPGKE